jgi:hypothetical protein
VTDDTVRNASASAPNNDPIPKDVIAKNNNKVISEVTNAATVTTISAAAAEHVALEHEFPGSVMRNTLLASVTNTPFGQTSLCWVVAVNPKGGLHAPGAGGLLLNYDVHFVSALTGEWLGGSSGYEPGLTPIPPI